MINITENRNKKKLKGNKKFKNKSIQNYKYIRRIKLPK